jgi:DNA-binding NtrC family response regulator
MSGLDATATKLPIVLVVDPVAASRHMVWRTLSRSFGVLEAPDARRAREWLTERPDIGALVVQRELPDAHGSELVKSLVLARADIASRSILVGRPMDLRTVIASLTDWFFGRDVKKAQAIRREAERLVS